MLLVGIAVLVVGADWWLGHRTATPEGLTIDHLGRERYVVLREFPPGSWYTMDLSGTEAFTNGDLGDASPIVRLRIDEDGFVLPSRVHANPDFSVVFLGGSTTLCKYVAEEQRFPYLAGRLLEQRTGEAVNAFNSARIGNDAVFSINKLINVILPAQPDAVVLMHNANDLTQLMYTSSYWDETGRPKVAWFDDYTDLSEVAANLKPTGFLPHLRRASGSLWRRFSPSGRGQADRSDEWRAVRDRPAAIDSARIERDFRRALESFVLLTRTWGSTPVLMTQQNRISDTPPTASSYHRTAEQTLARQGLTWTTYQRLYARLNDVTRAVAQEHGMLLIDLDRRIPHEAAYIYDTMHFNQAGSERAAAVIADALAPLVTERPGQAP